MALIAFKFEGRAALVVGAGKTGLHRARLLKADGCHVVVADPAAPHDETSLTFVREAYSQALLQGYEIVVAATNDAALNQRIVADCKARGILVNSAENDASSDFSFVSTVSRGLLTLGVSTGGASPALSRCIRKELEERYDESYAVRTELLKNIRALVLSSDLSASQRRRLLTDIADKQPDELTKILESQLYEK